MNILIALSLCFFLSCCANEGFNVHKNLDKRDIQIVKALSSNKVDANINYQGLEELFKGDNISMTNDTHLVEDVTLASCRYVLSYPNDESGWDALRKSYEFHDGEYADFTMIIENSYEEQPDVFKNKAASSNWVKNMILTFPNDR